MQGLRKQLRVATRDAHDELDTAMQGFDLHRLAGFARFLKVQLAARAPIEEWCARNGAPELVPPAQSPLITCDLAALGETHNHLHVTFAPPPGASAIGVVWTLAGSSLGNRAILADLAKHGCYDHPRAFLSDGAMPQFWKQLRSRFEGDASDDEIAQAAQGALAVFATFQTALAQVERELAA